VAADELNQKIAYTFSGPVEIPGQVLAAETYVIKLMDSPSIVYLQCAGVSACLP
jgi:hypothetical protein